MEKAKLLGKADNIYNEIVSNKYTDASKSCEQLMEELKNDKCN